MRLYFDERSMLLICGSRHRHCSTTTGAWKLKSTQMRWPFTVHGLSRRIITFIIVIIELSFGSNDRIRSIASMNVRLWIDWLQFCAVDQHWTIWCCLLWQAALFAVELNAFQHMNQLRGDSMSGCWPTPYWTEVEWGIDTAASCSHHRRNYRGHRRF